MTDPPTWQGEWTLAWKSTICRPVPAASPTQKLDPLEVQQGCCLSVADLPYCPLARLAIASTGGGQCTCVTAWRARSSTPAGPLWHFVMCHVHDVAEWFEETSPL